MFFAARIKQRKEQEQRDEEQLSAYEQLIAKGTPLVRLHRISKLVDRNVYVKMESLNPGGTGKDRAALSMIQNAEAKGLLPPPQSTTSDLFLTPSVGDNQQGTTRQSNNNNNNNNNNACDSQLKEMIQRAIQTSRTGGLVVEGTSGSTGIALATLSAARGHACLVILPDDQAVEKQAILRSLGAVVYEVPTAAISNPNHYVNLARKAAKMANEILEGAAAAAFFVDQFENASNYEVHYQQTGPEIWSQLCGRVDAFVMSSGTGGTIAGVGTYLKEKNHDVNIVLVDPPGSALHHKVEHGVAYAPEQRERTLRKHRYDTLAEGIGLDRVTHNFSLGLDSIDSAIRVTDQEAVDMAHFLLQTEGLWVGSSSAMNVVGAIRTALELPPESNVVTIVCDGGQRHATRFWSPKFVQEWGLKWPGSDCIPACLQSSFSETKPKAWLA